MKFLTISLVSATALALAACATSEPPQPALTSDMSALSPERVAEISALNDVASALIDAEALYRDAALMPDNEPRVRKSLDALADQRSAELKQVQRRVMALGGEPDQFGKPLGSSRRLYADLRTIVANDTRVAIEEVIRGERIVKSRIEKRLDDASTATSRQLLRTIRGQVAADIRALERLKAEET